MHQVGYNGQMSIVMSAVNSIYCRIPPKGLLYDAERDLLAIAKFFVEVFD